MNSFSYLLFQEFCFLFAFACIACIQDYLPKMSMSQVIHDFLRRGILHVLENGGSIYLSFF